MTIQDFIEQHGLTMTVEPVDSNPHMTGMPYGSRHSRCTIVGDMGVSMTVHFSQGPALTEEPTLAEVLSCLADDAASVDNARSFDEWAEELGYFPIESSDEFRKAERTFQTVEQQASELRSLLGDDAYETLLYNVERS